MNDRATANCPHTPAGACSICYANARQEGRREGLRMAAEITHSNHEYLTEELILKEMESK